MQIKTIIFIVLHLIIKKPTIKKAQCIYIYIYIYEIDHTFYLFLNTPAKSSRVFHKKIKKKIQKSYSLTVLYFIIFSMMIFHNIFNEDIYSSNFFKKKPR